MALKILASIYSFVILVFGGAFFGFVVGLVATVLNSMILFYGFGLNLGSFLGSISIGAPTLGCSYLGYRSWRRGLHSHSS